MRALTLTSTGNITGFGRVSLPEAPRRVSSTRYSVLLRGQFAANGDHVTVIAACDEHPAVIDVKIEGRGNNRSFKVVVNTTRARDAHRFTYQVIDDLFRAIMRKTEVVMTSGPDTKPVYKNRRLARH